MSAEEKARLAALEAENQKLKKDAADFAEAQAVAGREARHAVHSAFAEGLVKEGKLLPAHKGETVAMMDHLADPERQVEFGEGDAKKPLLDVFKAFLQAQQKQVEFGEIAGGAAQQGEPEEMSPEVMAAKAVSFQESEAQAGRRITTAQAVQHILAATK